MSVAGDVGVRALLRAFAFAVATRGAEEDARRLLLVVVRGDASSRGDDGVAPSHAQVGVGVAERSRGDAYGGDWNVRGTRESSSEEEIGS